MFFVLTSSILFCVAASIREAKKFEQEMGKQAINRKGFSRDRFPRIALGSQNVVRFLLALPPIVWERLSQNPPTSFTNLQMRSTKRAEGLFS
jgi:hypothetical protein